MDEQRLAVVLLAVGAMLAIGIIILHIVVRAALLGS